MCNKLYIRCLGLPNNKACTSKCHETCQIDKLSQFKLFSMFNPKSTLFTCNYIQEKKHLYTKKLRNKKAKTFVTGRQRRFYEVNVQAVA